MTKRLIAFLRKNSTGFSLPEGPQMEVYHFTLWADNSTETRVSLGDLGGGSLLGTAVLEGEGSAQALVASLRNAETGEEEAVLRWTRRKGAYIYTRIQKRAKLSSCDEGCRTRRNFAISVSKLSVP